MFVYEIIFVLIQITTTRDITRSCIFKHSWSLICVIIILIKILWFCLPTKWMFSETKLKYFDIYVNNIMSSDEALCSHTVSTNKQIRFKHIMFILTGGASAHPSHVSRLMIGTTLNITPPPLAEATPTMWDKQDDQVWPLQHTH